MIPYTPENPDRLINYAIRIAKENDGEVNVLRVLTVPDQTPLSAGVAFADAARKSFEPLEKILKRENILNHHLFRISHETSEAILATIEEQTVFFLAVRVFSEETRKSREKSADLILSAVNTSQPDLVVTSATIGKFSFFNNSHFLSLLDQLRCTIVIARQFTFPGVHRVKAWFLKLIRK
ncbi:MAG: hypothetical protein WBF33_09930 [Candidatus Nitrosopolaris sp.]